MTTTTTIVRNAFTGRRGKYAAYFQAGQAWVWDRMAGHYTTCHCLTRRQIALVRARASRAA
jgi:hypothetical protein